MGRGGTMSKAAWVAVCGTVVLYVVVHWITKESAYDFWDTMTNTVGIAAVIAAAKIGERRRRRKDHRDDLHRD